MIRKKDSRGQNRRITLSPYPQDLNDLAREQMRTNLLAQRQIQGPTQEKEEKEAEEDAHGEEEEGEDEEDKQGEEEREQRVDETGRKYE